MLPFFAQPDFAIVGTAEIPLPVDASRFGQGAEARAEQQIVSLA